MKITNRLLLIAALFALVLPLVFTGNAMAIYAGDGTKPNATGTWDITDYGQCVTGVKSDGTLVIDATKTSRPDCESTIVSALTGAACTGDTDANGGSHYATSVCIATGGSIDGQAVSLKDLDRTATMCNQAAIKAGGASGAMVSNLCTGKWTYTGPAGDGAPGFCYKTIIVGSGSLADANFYTEGNCPTGTTGFSASGTGATYKCTNSYGIAGYQNAALAKKDGSGNYAAANAFADLSGLNQGQCLFNGGSWSTGTIKSGATSVATTIPSSIAIVENTRAGCLECHNNTSQNNGYAGRWKTSYMLTGHKNMLRKVAQDGTSTWKGPDANGALQTYTAYAAGSLNFNNGGVPTAQVSGVDKPLLYIFGDWMAPAPGGLDVIVNISGSGKYNGTSNYSCAACHTAGWSNNDGTSGICNYSSKTTQATCEAVSSGAFGAGVWTPLVGVQGASYAPAEPAASYPSITFTGAGNWDREGIVCSRCHQSVFSKTSPAPAGTDSHNVTPKNTANEQVNNTCYSCHQSVAKTANGTGADADLSSATIIPVKNASTAPAYTPEFNGHVLGDSFLNSPHARFTGTITPNSLGKYELTTNTPANYNSTFTGFVCRSSATAGSGSVLETVIKSGVISEIKTQDDCNDANGKSHGTTGYWQAESKGSCTTCHDVHNSLFVNDPTQGEALRRECETCHEDTTGTGGTGYAAVVPQVDVAAMDHPKTANTPFDVTKFVSACETCHMPKATSGGFPMHLFRINSDASYETFPTAAEFGIGATATLKNARAAADDKGYANAVWVDVNYACGQCHYTTGANYVAPVGGVDQIPVFTKTQLAAAADALHTGGNPTGCLSCHSTAQGDYRAVVQGTNHHSGSCTMCHTTQHQGTPIDAAVNLNATTLKPAGSHNPLPYWSINSSLSTFCLSCHSTARTRSSDGATLGAIVPSGAGDNHHNGHSSVPGTNYGGVSDVNGSRGDNDPGMNCLGCHGKTTIVSGDNSTGYVLAIAGSGLPTTTVSTASSIPQDGANATSSLCLGCHGGTEIIQSGASQNHHAGICATCHHIDGSYSGTYPAGVGTLPAGDPCLNCHSAAVTRSADSATLRAVNQGVDHHNGTCTECHGEVGGVPAWTIAGVAVPNTNATTLKPAGSHNPLPYWSINTSLSTGCLGCHSTDKLKADGVTLVPAIFPSGASDNHHGGHSSVPGTSFGGVSEANGSRGDNDPGMNCLGCHGKSTVVSGDNTVGYTITIAGSGLSTTTVATQNGRTGGATPTSSLCLGCHEVVQSGATQDHHAGACITCHHADGSYSGTFPAGVGTAPAGDPCLNCHATAQGTKRAINQGVDHHNGACTECHGEVGGVSAWTIAGVAAPNTNATTLKPAGSHNPLPYWSINTSLSTACLGCHSTAKTRSSDSATLGAIAPSGAGDNHHGGHSSVPGTSFGGVSEANGSRGDNDPGMNCLGCHGKSTVVSGDNTVGYTITIAGSGLSTTTVSTQNGRTGGATPTSSLCLGCHEVVQSGATQDHHTGACIVCHHADGSYSGTFPAGVGTAPAGDPCLNCHATAQTRSADSATLRAVNQGVDHHNGTCIECHGEVGGVPAMPAPNAAIASGKINDTIITSCLTCHATDQTKSDGVTVVPAIHPKLNTYGGINDASGNQADNHHRGHSGVGVAGGDPGLYCLGCHGSASNDGSTYTITGSGLSTTTVSTQKGFPALFPAAADATSSLCKACHGDSETLQFNGTNAATANHHAGACVSCHQVAAVPGGAGATNQCIGGTPNAACGATAGVGGNVSYKPADVASWSGCTACHATEVGSIKYAQMSSLTCEECHNAAGVLPDMTTGGPGGVGSVCSNCHAGGVYDAYATNMHLALPEANFAVTASGLTANVDGSASSCPSGKVCTYDFDFGDGAHVATQSGGHTYASGGSKTIVLTVGVTDGVATSTKSRTVTLVQPNSAPVAHFGGGTPSASGWTITVTDASTDVDSNLTGSSAITVTWGDGATSHTAQNGTVTHTYTSANTYTIALKATDAPGLSSTVTAPVTISLGTVTGTVKAAVGGAPVNLAKVTITVAGVTKTAYSNASGVYTIANVKPGTSYPMSATKGAVTYYNVPGGPSTAVTVNSGSNTVNFTP